MKIISPLVQQVKGSHKTLLRLIQEEFARNTILIDGKEIKQKDLQADKTHTLLN
jgi:hypothetical protein